MFDCFNSSGRLLHNSTASQFDWFTVVTASQFNDIINYHSYNVYNPDLLSSHIPQTRHTLCWIRMCVVSALSSKTLVVVFRSALSINQFGGPPIHIRFLLGSATFSSDYAVCQYYKFHILGSITYWHKLEVLTLWTPSGYAHSKQDYCFPLLSKELICSDCPMYSFWKTFKWII